MEGPLADLTLRAFAEDLASERPVPGGGSAAAYAGAVGAALAAMVGRIGAKKDPEGNAARIARFDELRAELLRLVDEDSAAFAEVAEAMRLPRGTDEEKRERTARMQAALAGAARVPLEAARAARRLLDACEEAAAAAPAAAASDIGVAALMAEAALRGAALNVEINLASLKDRAAADALRADLAQVERGADSARDRVLALVGERIGG